MFYTYVFYMLIMNVLVFALMGIDRKRAVKRQWRISEKILFGTAVLGGCFGGYIGMIFFHHKTRHGLFAMGLPVLAVAHACLLIYLIEANILYL